MNDSPSKIDSAQYFNFSSFLTGDNLYLILDTKFFSTYIKYFIGQIIAHFSEFHVEFICFFVFTIVIQLNDVWVFLGRQHLVNLALTFSIFMYQLSEHFGLQYFLLNHVSLQLVIILTYHLHQAT